MLGLPRIKTGESIGLDASPRVWITGNLGGAFFFKPSSSARRPASFFLASAGKHALDRLELVALHFQLQSLGFRLQEGGDLLVLGLNRRLSGLVGVDRFLGHGGLFDVFGAGEDTFERIVIGGRNRVVLVVMAAGTGDGEPQEAAGQRVDPVGVLVVPLGVSVIDRSASEEAQGRETLGRGRGPSIRSPAICSRTKRS